jgi:hypothetical protein
MSGAWLEIFKTGTHTSGNGITKEYKDDDLAHIVKTYNEQKDHEAPLVLGHPTNDQPAYGWAKELKMAGSKLLAYVDQVSGDIVDAVKRGEYKKVSIALYPDGLLRHIGLLGAVPPAVKGLAPVQFAEGEEFEEYIWVNDETRMPTVARIFSSLRDLLIEKFSLDVADKAINKDDVEYLQRPSESTPLLVGNDNKIATNYEEHTKQEEEDMEALKAKIEALEGVVAAQATQFSELMNGFTKLQEFVTNANEASAKKAEEDAARAKETAFEASKTAFVAFCETLAKDGKILPAEKEGLVDEYADLLKAEETLTFAEGAQKPSEKMKTRLESREPIFLSRKEMFADGRKVSKKDIKIGEVPAEFSEVANKIDPMSLETDKAIREYAEKHKVTYEEAAQAYAGS